MAGYKQNKKNAVSSYDPKETAYIYDAMQHLYNAAKCFTSIVKNHKEYIFASFAKEKLYKVIKLNNDLAKSVCLQ